MSTPYSAQSNQSGGRSGRRESRRRAVELLYEAAVREWAAPALLRRRLGSTTAEQVSDYTAMLVEKITEHRDRIDELLAEHARGWSLNRMPAVDLAILRLGVYELLWAADVPDAVAIDEAVGLARELSTEDSPRFVNGVLGRLGTIADRLRSIL